MKEITPDKKIEQEEKTREAVKKTERKAFEKARKEFRELPIYPIIVKRFDEEEQKIVDEIQSIQSEELKKVFMLPKKKREEKVEEMSRRDAMLTGLLGILKLARRNIL